MAQPTKTSLGFFRVQTKSTYLAVDCVAKFQSSASKFEDEEGFTY